MSYNGQQVPLIERLRSVPAAARVHWQTPNPLGYDTTRIPVGALCQEAADRIAELEAALQAGRDLMAVVHCDGGHYREAHGDRKAADDAIAIVINLRAELAAERERREAAEAELAAERSAAVAERGIAAPPT